MHYHRLYLGEIEAVTLFINPTDTEAPEKPLGLYRMTSGDFRRICDELVEHMKVQRRFGGSGEDVAIHADTNGIRGRWFRLSQPMAEWLAKQEPLNVVDDFLA